MQQSQKQEQTDPTQHGWTGEHYAPFKGNWKVLAVLLALVATIATIGITI